MLTGETTKEKTLFAITVIFRSTRGKRIAEGQARLGPCVKNEREKETRKLQSRVPEWHSRQKSARARGDKDQEGQTSTHYFIDERKTGESL